MPLRRSRAVRAQAVAADAPPPTSQRVARPRSNFSRSEPTSRAINQHRRSGLEPGVVARCSFCRCCSTATRYPARNSSRRSPEAKPGRARIEVVAVSFALSRNKFPTGKVERRARTQDRNNRMNRLTTIEHDQLGYMLDCGFFGASVVVLTVSLVYYQPPHAWGTTLLFFAAGFMSWTLIEYFLHRCIMHGLQPYKSWHEEHHRRPKALIVTPFAMSASTALAIVALALWLAPTIAA